MVWERFSLHVSWMIAGTSALAIEMDRGATRLSLNANSSRVRDGHG
jgi:hypothetical protein